MFYTNFNTGHGMQFFNEGEVSFDDQWANINIQDILPSWQWWIDSEGSSKLAADFDYGTKEIRNDTKANKTTLPYTQIGAYKGGSSLVLYGDVDAKNTMHLYKTDLAVNSASTAEVTFKKTSSGNAGLKLGVITKEDPTNVVEIDVPNSAEAGEWTTETLSLGSLAGKHIAAICLVVDGSEKDFQINVGGLRILDGKNHTPSAPSNFRIDRAYDSKEMILKWDLADYSEVKQYNVYAVKDGKEVYLGGVYDDIYYIKDLAKVIAQEGLTTIDSVDVDPADITLEKGEGADFTAIVNGSTEKGGAITIRVKAVGADGSESEPASEKYNYDEKVSNVVVDESLTESGLLTHATNPGQLDVSWNAPLTGDFDSYKFTVTLLNVSSEKQPQKVFTSTADKDATSAVVPLPVAEGCDYDLAISTVKDGVEGEPIYYRGRSNDSYAEPYTIDKMLFSGNSVRMVIPDAIDWQYLTVYADGKQIKEFKRGAGLASKVI